MVFVSPFFHQFSVLTWEELRQLLWKRRALLIVCLYLLTVCAAVMVLVSVEEKISPTTGFFQAGGEMQEEILEFLQRAGIKEAFDLSVKLAEIPSPIVLFQILSILWLPMFVGLISSDMISLDYYRRTLRFLMSRTSREVYYVSKLMAHLFFFLVLQFLSMSILLIVCAIDIEAFFLRSALRQSVTYFVMIMPFIMFLVAATAFISSISKKPSTAVIRIQLLWIWFLLIMVFFPKASPFYYQYLLGVITPFYGYGTSSIVSLSLWAAGFVLAGLLIFSKRDI